MEAKRTKYAYETYLTREQCIGEPKDASDDKMSTPVRIQPEELQLQTSIRDSCVNANFRPIQGTISVDVGGEGGFLTLTINTKRLYSRLGISPIMSHGAPKAICAAIKMDRVHSTTGDSSSPTTVYAGNDQLHESQLDHNRALDSRIKREFSNVYFYAPRVLIDAVRGTDKAQYAVSLSYREPGLLTARFTCMESEMVTGHVVASSSTVAEQLIKALHATKDESLETAFETFTDTVYPSTGEEREWKLQPAGKGQFNFFVKLPTDCFTEGEDVYAQVTRLCLTDRR